MSGSRAKPAGRRIRGGPVRQPTRTKAARRGAANKSARSRSARDRSGGAKASGARSALARATRRRRTRFAGARGGWTKALFALCLTVFVGALGALVIGGVVLLWTGVSETRARHGGVRGEVSPVDCRWIPGRGGGWSCSGPFAADDASLHIERVEIRPRLDEKPAGPVATNVTGTGATTAWTPDSAVPYTTFGGGTVFLGVAGWIIWTVWGRSSRRGSG